MPMIPDALTQRATVLLAMLLCVHSGRASAQAAAAVPTPAPAAPAATPAVTGPITADSLRKLMDAVDQAKKEARVFKLGFSVGLRVLAGASAGLLRDASIEPATGNVRVDPLDRTATMASGVLAVFPQAKHPGRCAKAPDDCRAGWLWRMGFLANIKLAAFGADESSSFNQSIEGGIGPAFRFSDDFAIAATIERVFSRRLRNFVTVGSPLYDSAYAATRKPLTALKSDDDRFFRSDNLTAFSVKFVYFLR